MIERQLIDFIQMMASAYPEHQRSGHRDFLLMLLEHGRLWTPAPLDQQPERGEARQCYRNALELSYGTPLYCEGYAVANGVPIPILHAWCLTEDGLVLEPTWSEPGVAYLGIAVTRDYHMKIMMATRRSDLIQSGFPWFDPATCLHPVTEAGKPIHSVQSEEAI